MIFCSGGCLLQTNYIILVYCQRRIENFVAMLSKKLDNCIRSRSRQVLPACKLWLNEGKNNEAKIVANPNIGYGLYTLRHAYGTTREFNDRQ